MKAKEYFNTMWVIGPGTPEDRLNDMVIAFIKEIKTIGEARHATSDAAFYSIVKEQELKWKALMRMISQYPPGALDHLFMGCLDIAYPSIAEAVRNARKVA